MAHCRMIDEGTSLACPGRNSNPQQSETYKKIPHFHSRVFIMPVSFSGSPNTGRHSFVIFSVPPCMRLNNAISPSLHALANLSLGTVSCYIGLLSGLENQDYGVGNSRADHATPLYPQKLTLNAPTNGCRSVGIIR
jgi:hypothetical protein